MALITSNSQLTGKPESLPLVVKKKKKKALQTPFLPYLKYWEGSAQMNVCTDVNQAKLAACWGQGLSKHQLFVLHCREEGDLQITSALNFLPQPELQQQRGRGSASWRCCTHP